MESKKKTFQEIEFIVPTYYASALCLGDFSGLNDNECLEIDAFIERVYCEFRNANFIYDFNTEPYFSTYNRVNKLAGDVCRVTILIEQK